MAQTTHSYTQGHTSSTLATHMRRTAEADAGFLLPHIQKTDHILDIGCGPGTITIGFAKYATEGTIIGADLSEDVLKKATSLAAESGVPSEGRGSVTFQQGDILHRLPFQDSTFDVVYCSQLFGHLIPPEQPLQALSEIRRVLKPGGIFAAREGLSQRFYPSHLNLDKLWGENASRVYMGSAYGKHESTNTQMLALLRKSGFDVDGGKVQLGGGTSMLVRREAREWIIKRGKGQLQPGEPFYENWVKAGISEEETDELRRALKIWVETEDAWFASMQVEILACK